MPNRWSFFSCSFPAKYDLTLCANCQPHETICMKCQILFSRKNKKNLSKCCLLKSHWGGSNEYPQSMFLRTNKKNNVYHCEPQFYYIKVGFKGIRIYIGMFSWCRAMATWSLVYLHRNKIHSLNTVFCRTTPQPLSMLYSYKCIDYIEKSPLIVIFQYLLYLF